MSKGIVPDCFKLARVIPIFKNGSQMSLNNYRPISLLSVFNRILEKLMFKRLMNFIVRHGILYNKQFGFRQNHSTLMAVLSITDKIQKAIDDSSYECRIFLDLSKAFDTVNHTILLQKLECYGIRGVAKGWFESYLQNRQQFISLGNMKSTTSVISCSVPQGSVLEPLPFLLYMNDFQNSSRVLDFHLFADDLNPFCENKSLAALEKIASEELAHIHEWLCANKLSLNIEKSNFVVFHPPQKKLNFSVKIVLLDKVPKYEKNIKYLGVVIDCHLNWKAHISYLTKKLNRNIGALSKLRHFVTTDILTNLYYSLLYPFFTYGLIAWGNKYSTTINPLFILQKKAICIITFSYYR